MKNTNKNTINMNNNKSDSENSNNFNKYFTSIGAEINNSFNDPYSDILTNITSNTSSIFFEPVTVTEIENILHKCSDKFSNDSHGFNLYLLRRIITSISHIIMYLFNLSINAGIFTDILKTSKVIVIYKKHNRCDYSNYRPISITSQFSKIFEKLIKIRILSFLNKNKILNMCQFGFKESTSTCDALLDFIGYLQTNNDKHCAAVSIDIKKAFDSLDNYILLEKLYLYGFRGLSGDFIKSYLTNRNQYVHFNSSIYSTLPIKYGIP